MIPAYIHLEAQPNRPKFYIKRPSSTSLVNIQAVLLFLQMGQRLVEVLAVISVILQLPFLVTTVGSVQLHGRTLLYTAGIALYSNSFENTVCLICSDSVNALEHTLFSFTGEK